MKQIADAEKSNKKQGLGIGSRGGKRTPAAAPAAARADQKDKSTTTPPPPPPPPGGGTGEGAAVMPSKPKPDKSKTTKTKKATTAKPKDAVKPKDTTTKQGIGDIKSKPLIGKDGLFASDADFDAYKKEAGFDDVSKKQIARFFAESSIKKAQTASKYVIAPPSSDMPAEQAAQVEKLRKTLKSYQEASGKVKDVFGNMLKKAGFEDPDRLVLAENTKAFKEQTASKLDNQGYAPAQLITPFVNKYFPKQSKEGAALAKAISKVKATDDQGIDKLAEQHTWEGAKAVIEFAKKLNQLARQKHSAE